MLRIELRAELKRLQRDLGATFLLATPDFSEALAVADSVIMLRSGCIVQVATAQSLYDDPVDREVARFVGTPEINLLEAVYETASQGTIRVAGASIAGLTRLQKSLPKGGGPFEIGIRPEQLKLSPLEAASIQARVFDVEPLGLKSMLTVKNEEAEMRLVIDADSSRGHVVGDAVGINVIDANLLAFDTVSGIRIA
jgi:multiple sugar transport system ATP-binding protein